MLTLPKIFSDKALYLHSSPLDICGLAEHSAKVKASVAKDGQVFSEGTSLADENGKFTIRVHTPAASFDEWSITVSTENESIELKEILFGELWLACGQSNMEMPNSQQPEWETEVKELIKGKKMRFFNQPKMSHDYAYPIEPKSDTDGWWMDSDNSDKVGSVSAIATVFSNDLYDYLNAKCEMPVGFLNCSRGGTCIETWLPHGAFDKYPKINYKKPDLENWNQKGEGNYQQPGAHYNFNTHSHLGVKTRGMLWYQGETNLGAEQTQHIYKDLMIALRESYKELFAPSDDDLFPIVSSLIYPWKYWNVDESHVGYLNKCFTDLAKAYPDAYPFVANCDLSPIWTYHLGNHPIHPAHKYALGRRFALLCLNKYYGREGKNIQMLPPTLKSCVRHGTKLRLTFENVGSGLYIAGDKIRGMYIKSDKSSYVPAKCEVVNKSVINVWNDHIDNPKHVAYAVSSHEAATNLYGGEFSVAPFCTEFDKNGVTTAYISRKPWLDLDNDSDFVIEATFNDTVRNACSKPIYYPAEGSFVCYDKVYTLSGRSLKIEGRGKEFGAYVLPNPGASLDLENYTSLSMDVYNSAQNDVKLVLYYKEENGMAVTYSVNGEVTAAKAYGWQRRTFDLTSIPKGVIEKMELSFKHTAGKVPFVNIDNIDIVPKN